MCCACILLRLNKSSNARDAFTSFSSESSSNEHNDNTPRRFSKIKMCRCVVSDLEKKAKNLRKDCADLHKNVIDANVANSKNKRTRICLQEDKNGTHMKKELKNKNFKLNTDTEKI